MSVDAADFAVAAEGFADISRAIIRAEASKPRSVTLKADATPVTPVDQQVERCLRTAIEASYPSHGILGEEHAAHQADSDYLWVLDPIDGTKAFIAGLPVFGTLIALTWRGTPVLGVLDSPMTQQRWLGIDGHGTYLNGERVYTRRCENVRDALVCTSSPIYFEAEPNDLRAYQNIKDQARWMIFGGGCHTFGGVANGYVDVALETAHDFFDYLALVPIVANAGGVISDWQGNALTIASGSRFIASGDRRVHDDALALLDG